MSKNTGKPAAQWLNYSYVVPLPSMVIEKSGFRRLYQIIQARQQEFREYHLSLISQLPEESEDQYNHRYETIKSAYVTSVTVSSFDSQLFTGNNEDMFDSPNLPENIRSVFISTETVPLAILQFKPSRKIVVFLDFSRPPLIDLSRLPTLPTPNESSFTVEADDDGWASSSKDQLTAFFAHRRAKYNLLHAAGIYDVLLFSLGIPLGLWAAYRCDLLLHEHLKASSIVFIASDVYAFFFSVFIFRFMFSYARWVFPKVEFKERSPSVWHRFVWGTIALAIVSSFVYDFLKNFF